jgi:hypothetical protein
MEIQTMNGNPVWDGDILELRKKSIGILSYLAFLPPISGSTAGSRNKPPIFQSFTKFAFRSSGRTLQ